MSAGHSRTLQRKKTLRRDERKPHCSSSLPPTLYSMACLSELSAAPAFARGRGAVKWVMRFAFLLTFKINGLVQGHHDPHQQMGRAGTDKEGKGPKRRNDHLQEDSRIPTFKNIGTGGSRPSTISPPFPRERQAMPGHIFGCHS